MGPGGKDKGGGADNKGRDRGDTWDWGEYRLGGKDVGGIRCKGDGI